MNQILLLTGIVIVICILSGRLIDKLGVPSLLAFILLGMCFGVDCIFKISFDDYQEEKNISFVKFHLLSQHPYVGKCLKEITLPPKLLVVVLIRGNEILVPNGDTCLKAGDLMVAAAEEFRDRKNMTLREITIDKNHKWNGKSLSHIPMPEGTLVVMDSRQKETMIPTGNTIVYEGDVLVLAKF